jgi:hypothetical protein
LALLAWMLGRCVPASRTVLKHLADRTILVHERLGFEHQGDSQRFLADLRERFARFGLELHPGKTRLIEFGRHAARRKARRLGKPETFDFLGFTHICGKTRDGRFSLRRVTISKRMRVKLREVKDQLLRHRHQPVPEQGRWLASVVRGHCAYTPCPATARQSGHPHPGGQALVPGAPAPQPAHPPGSTRVSSPSLIQQDQHWRR